MPTAYTLPIKLFGGISTLTDLDLLQACVIVRSERYRTTHGLPSFFLSVENPAACPRRGSKRKCQNFAGKGEVG